MQRWWRDWWESEARGECLPVNDPGDFGWYDEAGVKRWGIHYYLSRYNPGHLPRPGGVMALTKAEWHDLSLLLHGLAWAQFEESRRREMNQNALQLSMQDYTK
jgi:hypothetical protein